MMFPPGIELAHSGSYSGRRGPVSRHAHAGAELVLVTAGDCSVEFAGGVTLPGRPGSVYVTPPGVAHIQFNGPECETCYLVLAAAPPEFDFRLRVIETGNDALTGAWFRQIGELARETASEQAAALVGALLLRLRHFEELGDRRGSCRPELFAALRHLESHYAEPLQIRGLAARCGLSRSHFNTLFRKEFGVSPLAYLSSLRLRAARRLLQDPHLPVGEVAERSGFVDPNYFSRAFRRSTGMMPLEFRRRSESSGGVTIRS